MNSKEGFNKFDLSQEIVKALNSLGYIKPTEVQEKVIPLALQQQDLVVSSQTGSGKTAGFGIPICEQVSWSENKPQALILTPTRELAAQVKEDITNIGRYKRIKAIALYGKQSFAKQKLELKQKNHVVVGTPGRVLDHIQKGTFPLERLQFLVLDEADEMLNMGFIEQVESILYELPKGRVTMLFSATISKDVKELCKTYMQQPNYIEIKTTDRNINKIEHFYYEVSSSKKFGLLLDVLALENPDSCLIFCRTHEQVNDVLERLAALNFPCDKIHGGMYQEDRFAVMDDFKRGKFRYLVATDVAARGIDVERMTHVINYDCPTDAESYVHRIGRTGRAGEAGKAITFITPSEDHLLQEFETYAGVEINRTKELTIDEIARHRASFENKMKTRPSLKKDKAEELNQEIMKLYFNGGRKKKLRAVDFVGTIARIDGVSAEDIGIITIHENESFVEILNGKGIMVLQNLKKTTIKGKQLKVHKAFK
ncbi:DEAD/DEAH box helicase [Bacillus horti]|uniref:ATP-dependent RNA helicase DbpA n=1 Tax=Caldalkalibacillus horti TaxID=77523 RepID=A0ABT9VTU0_9BACI|nr:DEAD/DEAH box helicase [Bacillus horti]MDQ0164397.1 superfamily II DNA/RNA helicase [Bacillus horti]